MNIRLNLLILCLIVTGASRARGDAPPVPTTERLRFVVRLVEERAGTRTTLGETHVSGPNGTDFSVTLRDARYRMKADFITDVIGPDRLAFRVDLETRRAAGRSARDLLLYEEDTQHHDLALELSDTVVLLPFGDGGNDRLTMEIVPERLPVAPANAPLDIQLPKIAPGGVFNVTARHIPHRFTITAELLRDGATVARTTTDARFRTPGPISFGNGLPSVSLNIEDVTGASSQRFVAVSFDVTGTDGRALGRNWSGIGQAGSTLSYDLPDGLQLKLAITPVGN